MEEKTSSRRSFWIAAGAVFILAGVLATSSGRSTVAGWLGLLRVQKAQAVNVDLSAFSDPNANPELHQMVSQMISDKVVVTASGKDEPASGAAAAAELAGFPPQLITARKDEPSFLVAGEHAVTMSVDRARLQEILKAAGHPELVLPASLDGASFSVRVPKSIHVQYGNCPKRPTAGDAVTRQVVQTPSSSSTDYSDCLRLTEGATPIVDVPPGLDVEGLAEIGLQVAGMTPAQARDFFQTVDWKSTLTLAVPRQLRSYEQVQVSGSRGTLLKLAGRRGPGYTLLWLRNGTAFSLTGYGDPGHAVELADSIK